MMLALTLMAAFAAQPADSKSVDAALELCKPRLAKEVAGDVSSINVDASSSVRGWTIIRGSMRALIGMGDPGEGNFRTHHLIRADYDFVCWTHYKVVMKIRVNRLR